VVKGRDSSIDPTSDPYELADVWPTYAPLYESEEFYVDPDDTAEWGDIDDAASLVAVGIRSEARKRIRRYLAMNGSAVWSRVQRSLAHAERLETNHPASSIVSSITAAELLIRFLLLRPLIAGLVFETRLAMRLIRDPFRRGQHGLDRAILPIACAAWDIDLDGLKLANGQPLWSTYESLVEVRNRYVHRADPVSPAQARGALDCTHGLVASALMPTASRLRLPWPPTAWSVRGRTHDPVEANYDYMGS
jgi:hypothetical protein